LHLFQNGDRPIETSNDLFRQSGNFKLAEAERDPLLALAIAAAKQYGVT
jgi:hypothetical protein